MSDPKVALFPISANLSVEQVLQAVLKEHHDEEFKEVLIVAFDKDERLVVRSSCMSRKDALWLAVRAQQHATGDLP